MSIEGTRLRVYVAGPYTTDPEGNTEFAIEVGQHLLELGFAPMVPHLTHFWHERFSNDWQTWMELDLPWVAMADFVVRIPGESSGADAEIALANELGIPVYEWEHSLEERKAGEVAFCEFCGEDLERIVDEAAERRRLLDGPQPLTVTVTNDLPAPVAEAIETIRSIFAKKNADYAQDSDWRSNFRDVAAQMGWDDLDAADALIAVKQARLKSLRINGRTPANESVYDTILDRAVYAVIALAIYTEDSK